MVGIRHLLKYGTARRGRINTDNGCLGREQDAQGRGDAEQKQDYQYRNVIQDVDEEDQKDRTCNIKTSSKTRPDTGAETIQNQEQEKDAKEQTAGDKGQQKGQELEQTENAQGVERNQHPRRNTEEVPGARGGDAEKITRKQKSRKSRQRHKADGGVTDNQIRGKTNTQDKRPSCARGEAPTARNNQPRTRNRKRTNEESKRRKAEILTKPQHSEQHFNAEARKQATQKNS